MTKAKVRRLHSKLSKIDRTHAQMDKRIDELKDVSLKLGMEIQELRDELQAELDDTPKRSVREVVQREAHA